MRKGGRECGGGERGENGSWGGEKEWSGVHEVCLLLYNMVRWGGEGRRVSSSRSISSVFAF